jgi:hypothetical protein
MSQRAIARGPDPGGVPVKPDEHLLEDVLGVGRLDAIRVSRRIDQALVTAHDVAPGRLIARHRSGEDLLRIFHGSSVVVPGGHVASAAGQSRKTVDSLEDPVLRDRNLTISKGLGSSAAHGNAAGRAVATVIGAAGVGGPAGSRAGGRPQYRGPTRRV